MKCILRNGHERMLLLLVLTLLASGCRPPDPISSDPDSATTLPSAAAPWPDSPAVSRSAQTLPEPSAPVNEVTQAPSAEEIARLNLVPIQIILPAPAFRGTPVPLKEPNVEKPRGQARAPFLAPDGTVNLAGGMPVTASDPVPAAGELDFVTDGDKEASDFGYLQLRQGTEWVQIDLGQRSAIYAVLVWHNHADARVYRDVIVQVSDDPDFLVSQTVFSNDHDNSSGLGIGSRMGYVETSEGRLIDARGVEGRFVRLYSRGNHVDDKNHYTEIEVFGTPAI